MDGWRGRQAALSSILHPLPRLGSSVIAKPPYDPVAASQALAQADPALGDVIARVGPPEIRFGRGATVFESVLRSVVYQQLSGKAAGTIYGRVRALFPQEAPAPGALLALDPEVLRGAGLSRAKTAAAFDLAQKTVDGELPDAGALAAMPDEEVARRLVAVRGVGPWTAQMVMLFDLGRPDVWPTGDLGVRRGVQVLDGLDALPDPAYLETRAERWTPWRSVAAWYLWRLADGR